MDHNLHKSQKETWIGFLYMMASHTSDLNALLSNCSWLAHSVPLERQSAHAQKHYYIAILTSSAFNLTSRLNINKDLKDRGRDILTTDRGWWFFQHCPSQ